MHARIGCVRLYPLPALLPSKVGKPGIFCRYEIVKSQTEKYLNKLSCKEARGIDLVEYLGSLGYTPKKIRSQDYWYCSPLRDEKTASFKVNRARNIWFDFGEGKGGDLIDFGTRYFKCSVNELLEKLSQTPMSHHFSFHQPSIAGEKNQPDAGKILILEQRPLTNPSLLLYLQKRCIPLGIAQQFCREIDFEMYGKKSTAIGFRNDKGGFELRNENFKGSNSPKASTFYDKASPEVTVFEGFFDFLSFNALHKNDLKALTKNFLVLNSLSFFHQVKDLMDKHQRVNLYLDRDKQGMKCTRQALQWDERKYKDFSKSFREGQDLNDWFVERQSYVLSHHVTKNIRHHQ
ncbi:MAG: DNA primase [Bacteroidetes bacterium]|nr:MAG: DNA primase [Bacteroidota bacterium]